MSYALETSKRKFNRLLDSISNSTSSSLTTTHARNTSSASLASFQPPSKRARVGGPGSERVSSLQPRSYENLSGSSVRSLRAVSPKIEKEPQRVSFTTLCGDRVEPYAPSSRQDFLMRLKTFSYRGVINWHLKPDNINEVRWAAHGWLLQGKETVRCTNCHKQIVLEYDEAGAEDEESLTEEEQEKTREENQKALADKYAQLLSEGHDERCLWRERPCDDTIYRLPVNSQSVAIPALKERYESILSLRNKLPKIRRPDKFDELDLYHVFIERCYGDEDPQSVEKEPDAAIGIADGTRAVAFAFAMLGWRADTKDQLKDGMVTCGACFRRLGFWMWSQQGGEGEASEEQLLCDIADEHRPYCPWHNGAVQNAGAARYHYYDEKLSGWECLARLLKNRGGDGSRPTSSSVEPVTGGLAGVVAKESGSGGSSAEANEDSRNLEHQARLGRWQRLKKTLTLPKKTTKALDD